MNNINLHSHWFIIDFYPYHFIITSTTVVSKHQDVHPMERIEVVGELVCNR